MIELVGGPKDGQFTTMDNLPKTYCYTGNNKAEHYTLLIKDIKNTFNKILPHANPNRKDAVIQLFKSHMALKETQG